MYFFCLFVFAASSLASSEDAQSKAFFIPLNIPLPGSSAPRPPPPPPPPTNIFQQAISNIVNRPPVFIPIPLPSTGSSSGSSSCSCPSSDFVSQAVSQHNCYRGQHHSPAVTQTASLNTAAQNYANVLAAKISSQGTSAFAHSPEAAVQHLYGENLALMPGCNINGCAAVDAWYNEIKQYSFSSPNPYNPNTGHFTQVVWKDSSQVGIGKATTFTQGACWTVVVANYLVPGNNPLTFSANVLPK